MELDLGNPAVLEALIEFTQAGARAGCPFCKGRMIASVSPGDRVVFLEGTHAGREAIVTSAKGQRKDEFLVNLDGDRPEAELIVNCKYDSFAHTPIDEIPNWLCGLSIDDLCAIDHATLGLALRLATAAKKKLSADLLLPLIALVRQRRLPVLGADLWPTLEAHGLPKRLDRDFRSKFDFAIEMHIALEGRPPIKKKRVDAMSIGRYQTPASERYFGPSPGVPRR